MSVNYLTKEKNFTLEEATRSQTAARMRVSNQPNAEQLYNLKFSAAKMERIRAKVNRAINVSSWLRVLIVNRAIGSQDTSAHIKGLAIDCTASGWTARQLYNFLAPLVKELEIDQLILEFDSWVHIGFTRGTPRNQVFTIGC